MIVRSLLVAAALIAGGASPAAASQAVPQPGMAPEAPPTALYCLRTEPITGTRIGAITCLTRDQWADGDVDVDQAWAEDGVRVIA